MQTIQNAVLAAVLATLSKARLPQGTTAFFVYGFRAQGGGRNNHAASELVVIKP